MNTPRLILALACCIAFALFAPLIFAAIDRRREEPEEIDVNRMLVVIAQLEGGDPNALGGAYCIARGTWQDRTAMPYESSREPRVCAYVARDQVAWIIGVLRNAKRKPTPAAVASVWRYGFTGYLRGRPLDYGRRAANLYNSK